jgi:hypothetical protein
MEIIVLCIIMAAKFVQDIAFGRKALEEVRQFRTAMEGRLINHDTRITSLEVATR